MFNFHNKTDAQIKIDVINEILWDPSITSGDVKVTANDGVITLRGSVPHYIEKKSAEQAAQRIGGVKAVADELEVKTSLYKSDEDIAKTAVNAMKWNYSVPETIKLTVDKGWITLVGEAEWDFQREAALSSIRKILGVVGVTNSVIIKSKVQPIDIKIRIEEALKRSAEAEGRNITVSVVGEKVTLSGKVHSFSEIEDAKLAAWNAPGVMDVISQLVISQ